MTTPTDSDRSLLTVVASMKAKPGKEAELREALENLVAPSRSDDGNVNYDLHQGANDSSVFYLYEKWRSAEQLDAHLQTPPLTAFVERTGELLDGELHIQRLKRIA
jgi:quinol monooxygenase YgiN